MEACPTPQAADPLRHCDLWRFWKDFVSALAGFIVIVSKLLGLG
jgi:hypothetical protein